MLTLTSDPLGLRVGPRKWPCRTEGTCLRRLLGNPDRSLRASLLTPVGEH